MLLELRNVRKTYGAFDLDISLEVQEGCITGLIGANGAGKTTAFKAILDLIHTEGGQILIQGTPVEKRFVKEKAQVGVVLAESGFPGNFNIGQIVKIMEKAYDTFQKDVFLKQCDEMKLPQDKQIKDFSTGMKAKLKILLAMSFDAKILILDEPTAGLDVVARDQILDLLRTYMETEGRGILISSHISSDLEGLCDDLYMIDQGKIVLHEETDVILDRYGLIKADEKQFEKLDRSHLLCVRREEWGYSCLTDEKNYYQENVPGLVVEKGSVDEVISMMVKGARV